MGISDRKNGGSVRNAKKAVNRDYMKLSSRFKALKTDYEHFAETRRMLQEVSGRIQVASKQSIFALQRGDVSAADQLRRNAEQDLVSAAKLVSKHQRLSHEGAWRACQEEYSEAVMFAALLNGADPLAGKLPSQDPDILIGGLSDAVGELVRAATKAVIDGNRAAVDPLYERAELVVEFLASMDLTGGLRSKSDQARQHLRRLEEIRYDIASI